METNRRYLIVVDLQNDFLTGALGSAEGQAILPAAVEKIKNFEGTVLFTLDTHGEDYAETEEGKLLPVPHCLKGTEGWQLAPEVEALQKALNAPVFEKPTFGSTALAHTLAKANAEMPIESIELIGVCTDICVISNALTIRAALPNVPMFVDAACCAGVTPEKHEAALKVMESCLIHVKR